MTIRERTALDMLYILQYIRNMEPGDFDDLLDDYLSGRVALNPDMADVEFIWVRGDPDVGSDHIAQHGVSEVEVEQVLLEIPPYVEAKRHKDYPDRTIFWGATRAGRWLFVVCVDWTEGNQRFLKPITAFEPEEGEQYWNQQ